MTTKTASDVFKKQVWIRFWRSGRAVSFAGRWRIYRKCPLSLRILADRSYTDHTGTLKELPKSSCCYSYARCTLGTFIWVMAKKTNDVCMTSWRTTEAFLLSVVSWTVLTSWAFKSSKLFLKKLLLCVFQVKQLARMWLEILSNSIFLLLIFTYLCNE